MKLFIYLIFVIISTSASYTIEIDSSKDFFGLNFAFNQIFNKSSISIIQGSSDCGFFSDGKSFGYRIGIIYYRPILLDNLSISGGLNYDVRPATLIRQNSEFEVLDPIFNKYAPLEREYVFNSSLKYITLDLGFCYKLLLDYPILFRIFFDIGNPLIEKDYNITEQIKSPNGVLFPDGTRLRTISGGKLNTTTTAIGFNVAFQYQFELNNGLLIVPEIGYRRGLNSIISDTQWQMQSINLCVQLITDFTEKKGKIKPEPEKIKIPIEIDEEVLAVNREQTTALIKTIITEPLYFTETIVTQSYPLLPYIFYDSASSILPMKYIKGDLDYFSEENLPKSAIDIYYHILDIIGYRLRKNPKAEITIVGVTDGSELPSESERLNLAKQRAMSVKDYLTNYWKISDKQIKISSRNLPRLPTSTQYQEGFEENRRVEIYSNENKILEPLIHKQFNEYELLNSHISSQIEFNDYENLKQFLYVYGSKGELLFERELAAGSFILELSYLERQKLIEQANKTDQLRAELKVIKNGMIERAYFSIQFIKKLEEFEIGRLNLIVFDYDKADISDYNRNIITHFLTGSIKPQSSIDIIGSTDRLGASDYNLNLSRTRAENVRDLIKSIIPNAKFKRVEGIGESDIYNNNSPEGRFYSRTVLIEIKTPIDK